jgi:hypothetical protein
MLALQTVGANSASDPLAVEMVKRIQAMTA